jgi:hypothetical protein
MSEEQINEAIATHIFGYEDYDMLLPYSSAPKRKLYGATKFANNWTLVPDYCNDLNAMREVEMTLSNEIYEEYWNQLIFVCMNEGEERMNSASAKLRAKAFAIIIGKWKE